MTGITQTIPSFVQGISGQPDELKLPGQVNDLVNAIPDVARGLIKRPGARLVNHITDDTSGRWFNINRDRSEQYVGQVLTDGTVNIWGCNDGAGYPVVYSPKPVNINSNAEPLVIAPADAGNTLYPNCDVNAYTADLNEYRRLQNLVSEQEELVEQNRTAANNLLSQNFDTIYYEVDYINEGAVEYKITTGYSTIHGDINKPTGATLGRKIQSDVYHVAASQYLAAIDGSGDTEFSNRLYEESTGVKGDIYEYVINSFPQSEYDGYVAAKTAAETQLATLIPQRNTAKTSWESEASNCAITANPFGASLTHSETSDTSVLLDYLKHDDPEDLQFLTINDFTFVSNRKIKPSTSKSALNERQHEGFIELKNLAYSRDYSVSFNTIASSQTPLQTITSAASVSVNKVNWADDNANCQYTAIQNFNENHPTDSNKTGLNFQIETRGQAVLKDLNDQYKGYKCEYTTNVRLLSGGQGWEKGDTVEVTMNGATYSITVTEISSRSVLGNLGTATESTPTSGSTIVQPEDVLTDLAAAIAAQTVGITADVIGNGIHVTSATPFQVTTNASDLLNVFTDSINDVSRLPDQCKHGYVVKVANSAELEDDYYLRFIADNGDEGYGVWEETYKPGIDAVFNGYSMPHQIVRMFNASGNVYFIVSPVDWEDRLVGDEITNPTPSFVGKFINKMVLFRNRLGMMSDENIILSRPGDFFNFWSKTAQVVSPIDPIDVSVSSSSPATLYDAQEVNAGLLMFSEEHQFLLTTDNDALTPDTAKVNSISAYGFNKKTEPISMGTTVGFISSSGRHSRLFEITNIRREGEAEVLDQSKVIDNQLPSNIDLLAHSRTNNLILAGQRGTSLLFGYQYFNTGEKRAQSAWFKWNLTGNIIHQYIENNVLYLVIANGTIVSLQTIDLKFSENSAIQPSDSVVPITVHLDNWQTVLPSSITHSNGQSTFTVPPGFFTNDGLRVWAIADDTFRGQVVTPTITSNTVYLNGDWSNTRVVIGYEFTMSIKLPTIYPTRSEGDKSRSDIRSSLTIHRLRLSFGPIGVYDVTLDRIGKGSRTLHFDQREMDGYKANAVAVDSFGLETIPIYERNTNLAVTVSSTHPSPATLYSMTWEGDYTNRFYRRV